nr:hypothetical protein [Tanacetum cinerariifolium]
MGEGSAIPTDPQHTPTLLQPSTSQPQKTKKPRKSTRKDTQVPQLSGPTESVIDEVVYKELDDSLVRAATTASSLEAEQDSGGGPRCQEAMGDTIARLGLRECLNFLMIHCSQEIKNTQANEIDSLKRRVKKLDKKQRSRTHKLKRLYKVGQTANVESSDDEQSLDLLGEEVFVATQDDNVVEKEVDAAQDKGKAIMIEEHVKLKKKDQIMIDEEVTLKLQAELQAEFDKEQKLAREKEKEANIALIETWDDMFDRAFKRVNTFVDFRTELVEGSSKRAEEEMTQESAKKQKVDDDKEIADLKQLMKIIPKEEIAIDAIPLAVKSPIVNWKIYKEEKKSYYQIIRAGEKSKMYLVFSHMLKDFDKEDLEDLYNLVKAKYGSTRPVKDLDLILWGDLMTMFEPHVKDEVWKMQKR